MSFIVKSDMTIGGYEGAKIDDVNASDKTTYSSNKIDQLIEAGGGGSVTPENVYTKTEVDTLLSGKAASNHNHSGTYAAASHTHDDRYYTESEVNNLLNAKANSGVIPVNPSSTANMNIWIEI